ncbi:MAG: hypothetical protein WAO10_06690 [Candidatus Sulfotelmatobacter sp.]
MLIGFVAENQIDDELSVLAREICGFRNLAASLGPRTNRIALQSSGLLPCHWTGTGILNSLRRHGVGAAERNEERRENREKKKLHEFFGFVRDYTHPNAKPAWFTLLFSYAWKLLTPKIRAAAQPAFHQK